MDSNFKTHFLLVLYELIKRRKDIMERYTTIKNNLLELAKKEDNIKAIVAIGSSTRKNVKADEYSDLDMFIITEDTYSWLYGDKLEQLGDIKISFVEPTLGGGKERRVLFDDALDVDMIILTPEQFEAAIKEGVASWVCNRGYAVLYDVMGFEKLLKKYVSTEIGYSELSEEELLNMMNDFYFHIVWSAKKILRGELWSAKMCIDAYLKNYLLKMMEMYSASRYNVDVWHDGRFLDRWADEKIKNELKNCFAHYEREDMIEALLATLQLFKRLAKEVAMMKNINYPKEAEEYAARLVKTYFGRE